MRRLRWSLGATLFVLGSWLMSSAASADSVDCSAAAAGETCITTGQALSDWPEVAAAVGGLALAVCVPLGGVWMLVQFGHEATDSI